MQQISPAGRLAAPSPCRRHHHQRMAFRGPLSLLWLALSVGTGPVACFVVLPTSTPVAAASPLPKIVLGSQQGGRGAARSSSRSGSHRRLYAFTGRSEQEGRALEQATDDEQAANASSAQQHDEDSSATAPTGNAAQHAVASTGIRNARALRVASALSQGKGFRAAATALRASATGLDVGVPTEATTTTRPKKILILMSDTGGGHRASSQALNAALENLYGDQIHTDIVDIWTEYGRFPFAEAVRTYKFLGKRPFLWKLSYDMARFPPTRRWAEVLANLTCHRSFRSCLEKYEPDLVVSMHPLCHHVPLRVLKRIREDTGKEIPFATVVTDLGSAHPTWFDPR
ncbi:unnamed protein product, partial [Ectocarpus sp. 13 AM-2016]